MSTSITTCLARLRAGEPDALEELVPMVYEQLRAVARRQLCREASPTLSATALVHELYLRLLQQRQIDVDDRASFYGVAARMMRRILVDHARRRRRLKRGGDRLAQSFDDDLVPLRLADHEIDELLAVDALMQRLSALDERAARVVECRIFAGFTLDETAAALGTSVKTVQRSWVAARAWLRKEIAGGAAHAN